MTLKELPEELPECAECEDAFFPDEQGGGINCESCELYIDCDCSDDVRLCEDCERHVWEKRIDPERHKPFPRWARLGN